MGSEIERRVGVEGEKLERVVNNVDGGSAGGMDIAACGVDQLGVADRWGGRRAVWGLTAGSVRPQDTTLLGLSRGPR